MITHLIKSINWIDVVLAFLFVRMIFVGVKNGFISEFFKLLGAIASLFLSLHYYSFLAAWAAGKTNISWPYWGLLTFALLWAAVSLFFKFFKDGMLVLFKVETTHQGFDKYAAGIVAVGRGILVCSMAIFLVLLTDNSRLMRMTVHSYSFKIAGHASVNTYSFLYNHLVGKLFAGEHYNTAAAQVLRLVR
ncbi:MAG: CvpA family protein [Candidatus Omnitrophica bacterium]|nr:CvpA family protein [Candidatus Omnitrophota bacterium]